MIQQVKEQDYETYRQIIKRFEEEAVEFASVGMEEEAQHLENKLLNI